MLAQANSQTNRPQGYTLLAKPFPAQLLMLILEQLNINDLAYFLTKVDRNLTYLISFNLFAIC